MCPGIVIGLLVAYSRIEEAQQNFARRFGQLRLMQVKTVGLPVDSYNFLGIDDVQILLNNRVAKRLIMQIDHWTFDTSSFIIPDAELQPIRFEDPRFLVTENRFVIADASIELMLTSTDVKHGSFDKVVIPRFSLIAAVTDTTFILRTYNNVVKQDVLTRINTGNQKHFDNTTILQKQLDGIFCVDGSLLFNKDLRRMVYVYFYRNEFITADPMLATVTRGHTIDETERVSIKVDTYEKNGERTTTFTSPPRIVNGKCATEGNYLYLVSNVKATNQQREEFEHDYTIDRYNLITHSYEGSFYLGAQKNRHELKNFDFIVSRGKLMAIFDDQLVIYDLVVNSIAPLFEQDPKQ